MSRDEELNLAQKALAMIEQSEYKRYNAFICMEIGCLFFEVYEIPNVFPIFSR